MQPGAGGLAGFDGEGERDRARGERGGIGEAHAVGGDAPRGTVGERLGHEGLEGGERPRLGAAGVGGAETGNVGGGDEAGGVAEAGADVGNDVGEPRVVVGAHRGHLGVVGVSGDGSGEAEEDGVESEVAVAQGGGGTGEGRGEGEGAAVDRSAAAVDAVAGETQFLVDLFAVLELTAGGGIEAGGDLAGERVEELGGDFFDGRGGVGDGGFLDEGFDLGELEAVGAQHRLVGHGGIGVLEEGEGGGTERGLAGFDERLAEAEGGDAEFGRGGAEGFMDERGVEGAEALKRPEGVETREGIGVGARQGLEGGHDGKVFGEDEEFLGGVAPPTVGVGEVGDELRGGFVEHLRARA